MNSGIRELFEGIFGVCDQELALEHLELIANRFSLIPYENLSKIVRGAERAGSYIYETPQNMLLEYKKWGAGGTCFSLTHCLRTILLEYGYSVHVHLADLARGVKNHCAIVVSLREQSYLIDPGYLITRPLPLPERGDVLHETRLNPVRLDRDPRDERYCLSTIEPDGEKHRYRLYEKPCDEEEFQRVWTDSFTWPMMNSILVTRVTGQGRFYAHDRFVRVTSRDAKEQFKIREQYDQVLAEQTGISPVLIRRARQILSRSKPGLCERGDN